MICQDIMNIIKNNVIMLRNKDKFNEVVKQINRIQHEYCEIHTITIKKKNYNVEFTYFPYFSNKTISRADTYYEISGAYVDDPPLALTGEWTDDLWDYCCYARNNDNINNLKEMERNVINYFNTLKPMERTIKIKK
jgi:hypothetical protein